MHNHFYQEDRLEHHGVQGMKWGVRRYQNPDGTLTAEGKKRYGSVEKARSDPNNDWSLPKGTRVYRLTTKKNEPLNEGTKYLYTDADKDIYEGAFTKFLKSTGSSKIYKKEYETTEDLIAPSKNAGRAAVAELMSQNKTLANYVQNAAFYFAKHEHPMVRNTKEMVNKIEGRELTANDVYYATYNVLVENSKSMLNALVDKACGQKYNALMDDNNRDIYNRAAEPFIVRNAKKSLSEISTSRLKDKDMRDAYERVRKKVYPNPVGL